FSSSKAFCAGFRSTAHTSLGRPEIRLRTRPPPAVTQNRRLPSSDPSARTSEPESSLHAEKTIVPRAQVTASTGALSTVDSVRIRAVPPMTACILERLEQPFYRFVQDDARNLHRANRRDRPAPRSHPLLA